MIDCTDAASLMGCVAGVRDCCFLDPEGLPGIDTSQCAASDGSYSHPGDQAWLAVTAFCTMALMSFGIGANDAANSWGTSVGSGAVTLTQAVVTGGLMDWLGATLLGSGDHGHPFPCDCAPFLPRCTCRFHTRVFEHAHVGVVAHAAGVSDTIQQLTDVKDQHCWACGFCDSKMTLFMLGMCAALLATAVFLLLSSTTGMPVSTTHAIVGAVVGMALVGTSPACLAWERLGRVALTWVTSPLLAGLFGAGLHFCLHHVIMSAPGTPCRQETAPARRPARQPVLPCCLQAPCQAGGDGASPLHRDSVRGFELTLSLFVEFVFHVTVTFSKLQRCRARRLRL